MKKIILYLTLLSVIIVACSDNNITETKTQADPEKNIINLSATFTVEDSTYSFNLQKVTTRYLSIVNLKDSEGLNDSLLIGYLTRFYGKDGSLDLFINKKLLKSDLEKLTKNTYDSFRYSEQSMAWSEYRPSKSQFESVFYPEKKKILKEHYYWTNEEGVAIFLNEFNWTSYNKYSENIPDDKWQTKSKFEIISMKHISNNEILNLSQKGNFNAVYADTSRNYLLVELSFDIELFKKEDSTETRKIRDGYIKAIVFR